MIPNKSALKKLSLEELVFGALSQLQVLHYNGRSISRYQAVWKRLIKFAKQHKFNNKLSQKLMLAFLECHEIQSESTVNTYHDWRKHAEFSLKILWNYARFGYLERGRVFLEALNIPSGMQKSLQAYKKYSEEKRHLSPYTVDESLRAIGLFLDFVGKHHIQTFDQIHPEDLSDFVYSLSRYSQKTISGTASYIRMFLWFLFICNNQFEKMELPRELVLQWMEKQPTEQVSTHQKRISIIRQFAQFMMKLGYPTYVPPKQFGVLRSTIFAPYIFTQEEIQKIFHAIDHIKPTAFSPTKHLVMPELFRLLYGCGFRLGEILNLRVRDIDLQQGVITVREGKFGKDRLVPPTLDMIERLRSYSTRIEEVLLEKRTNDAFFFPSTKKIVWSKSGIYYVFRKTLHQCGIAHGGRGKRPRVHDLRHTFAVHRLIQWYEEGADLNAKLPFLVAYLGHKDFTGTQKYLHLTAELFPHLTKRMNEQFGGVIPNGRS